MAHRKRDGSCPDLDHHSDNPCDFLPLTKLDSLAKFWRKEYMDLEVVSMKEQGVTPSVTSTANQILSALSSTQASFLVQIC